MKLSELKYAIREMIVSELMENVYAGAGAKDKIQSDPAFSKLNPQAKTTALKDLEKGGSVSLEEDALNEFAAFYKIKDDVDQEEAKAAIDKAIKDNPRQKNLQIALRILRDEEKVNFEKLAKALGVKSVATFNNQDSRKVLDGDLAPFISSSRLSGSEPIGPKEPKEPKVKGAKDSKKSDDAIAYTMGGTAKITGKAPTKALKKKTAKSALLSKEKDSFTVKDLKGFGLRDLDAIENQIKDLKADLASKLDRAKEIASKGNTSKYTPEEAEFMDDVRNKTEFLRRLKSTPEDVIKKTIKKQDLDIDVVSTDED